MNRYRSSGYRNSKRFGHDSCCGNEVQTPPEPCCESHETRYRNSNCFFVTCDVTISEGDNNYLTFVDGCADQVPLSANEVYFWHALTGLMRILSFDGTSYRVSLLNAQNAGAGIKRGECVLLYLNPTENAGSNTTQRCLSGNFVAPALNATQTMYILNGTAIPNGATLTITWQGNVGSYVVNAYIGGEGNIYAYTVENTGSGLTPGTIVNGGDNGGGCIVPVEVISTVDICSTAVTHELDSFAGCVNGSPRSGTATAPNQTWVSGLDAPFPFGLRTLANVNCCMTTMGCLKFTITNGCNGADTVTVANVGLDCLTEAWDAAVAAGASLPAIIDGFPFVITEWNEETRDITLSPVGTFIFDEESTIEFDAGTQICLGDCCNTCIDGPGITLNNAVDEDDPEKNANFSLVDPGALSYNGVGPTSYLVGIKTDGTEGFFALDDTYPVSGNPLPQHSNPLLIREKICNDSAKGCHQMIRFDYNWQLIFSGLDEGYRLHWEIGSFIAESATLEDNVTPNPNTYASSQAKVTGYIEGPITLDEDVVAGTGLGFGGVDQPKYFPDPSNILTDWSLCKKCDCINAILWLFIRIEPLDPDPESIFVGSVNLAAAWRRVISKFDARIIPLPKNDPTCEGWNT